MKALQKRLVSVSVVGAVLILAAAGVHKRGLPEAEAGGQQAQQPETGSADGGADTAADLLVWYEDATYTEFFEKAAQEYYERTKVKVAVQCKDTLDYIGEIYDETMQGDAFPDVYLISGDNLEEAYLYGLVSVNTKGLEGTRAGENAKRAASYNEKLLGYPLSYNTCVFVYQTDYFATAPESLQSIIDYSNENEPPENVEYLLEWDVNDAFYDFPFISNSVTFEKTQPQVLEVSYDEALYQKDLEYFEGILTSFSVDAEKVSEESIIANFRSGRTLSAILDTNSLHKLEGYSYSLMRMPELNEELPAYPCAITDMLLVNDFSEKGEEAADFAYFVTVAMADELHALSGHYSVIPSEQPDWAEEVAYDSYETAVLMPDSMDAKDFWVTLEETISQYFKD